MITIPGYKITDTIGRGGMATVYLATQESIGRLVAIKVMSPALAADPTFSDRFVKEARMANLAHPNIVTVYDAGAIDGTNYIVMEYASGGNLDTLIKQGISVPRAVEVMKQIASALHYSCSKGFIHRDVKPDNIIFREDGSAVLMDFGIAKAISSGTQLTMVGSTIGSPNYMSPEQARGLDLDGRSDLYSLGIVFYEILTGTKPYDAPDTYVIGLKHISDPIPQLPGKLSYFQSILDQLLAKSPDERFANGNQLIQALEFLNLNETDFNQDLPTIPPKITSTSSTDTTHVNIGHDDKTYNANTVAVESTETIPENNETQSVDSQNDNEESQLISEDTHVINDKTRVLSDTDQTRVLSPQDNKQDNNDKTQIQAQVQANNSKTGIVTLLVFIVIAGSGAFWYLSQPKNQIPPISEAPKSVTPIISPKVEISKKEIVTKDKPEPSEISQEDQIQSLLKKARHAIAKKRFSSPTGDNAFEYYSKILTINPNNTDASEGINTIAERYLNLAIKRYESLEKDKALEFIEKGLNIVPKHNNLLALRNKILQRKIVPKTSTSISSKIKANYFKSLLLKDLTILDTTSSHISTNSEDATWFARQDMSDKLYNRMLSQCNASDKLFNLPECIKIYDNYLKHWPLPVKGMTFELSKVDFNNKTDIHFDKQNVISGYKNRLDELSHAINNANNEKDKILALSNYVNYQSLASLFGIKTLKVDQSKTKTFMSSKQKSNQKILSKRELTSFVTGFIDHKAVYLAPIISTNSLEVTPYGSAIFTALPSELKQAQTTAKDHLYMDYALKPDGDVTLNLWLFNENNELIGLDSLLLDKRFLHNKRKSNLLFNNDIQPQQRLRSSYGFSASIAMDKQMDNPRLIIGNTVGLNIKLNQAGYYFIAVHVINDTDQYSYLLPLSQADTPFVQITTKDEINRFVELGDFKVTPPTGVEVLQLIASRINLKKFLPDNHWDEKRKQFIIDGSEGNIRNGINEVRNYINTLPKVSHDKRARWQERLLITSMLEN